MRKTIIGFLITVLVLAIALAGASCNGSSNQSKSTETRDDAGKTKEKGHDEAGEDDHDKDSNKKVESIDFSAQRNSQTAAVIDGYEEVKKALEAGDQAKAADGGKKALAAFKNFDATKITDSQRKEYSEIIDNAVEHSEHIIKSELDHQKEHFEELTTDVKDLLALVGAKKED